MNIKLHFKIKSFYLSVGYIKLIILQLFYIMLKCSLQRFILIKKHLILVILFVSGIKTRKLNLKTTFVVRFLE